MEQKKEIKISLKTAIIGIIIVLIIIGIILYRAFFSCDNISEYKGDYKKISYRGVDDISGGWHNGKYLSAKFKGIVNDDNTVSEDKNYKIISSKKELNNILSKIEYNINKDYEDTLNINPDYKGTISNFYTSYSINDWNFNISDYSSFGNINWDKNSLLIVECFAHSTPTFKTTLMSYMEDSNTANVKIYCDRHGSAAGINEDVYFIPISKKISNANIEFKYKKYNDFGMAYKPIIYLYPTEEKEVEVTLGYPDKITTSYPKYTTYWNVQAKPNGDLKDLKTGRNLYSLYYESSNVRNFNVEKYGFCIKGTEVSTFLEDKLAKLGLTEREAEEFIIYWLPKLESNKYNYIRFATIDEINANMPLNINPKPDTLIRVLMTYKGLNNPISVEEQELITPERKGFVAVEWGGTEIK